MICPQCGGAMGVNDWEYEQLPLSCLLPGYEVEYECTCGWWGIWSTRKQEWIETLAVKEIPEWES